MNLAKRVSPIISKLTEKISILGERISKTEGKIFGVAVSVSPINLTPMGRELVQKSGILDFLTSRRTGLIEKIKQQNSRTAYDVQEIARDFFSAEGLSLTEEELNQLKEHAFSEGVSLNDILYAASIYFRDVALEEFKFKIEELDKK